MAHENIERGGGYRDSPHRQKKSDPLRGRHTSSASTWYMVIGAAILLMVLYLGSARLIERKDDGFGGMRPEGGGIHLLEP